MDKRFLLAIGLSLLVLVVWQYLFVPPPSKRPALPTEVSEEALEGRVGPAGEVGAKLSTEEAAETVTVEPVAAERAEQVSAGNDLFEVVLTNKGARVAQWTLREFATRDGKPLELVPAYAAREDLLPFALQLDDPTLADEANSALFRVERAHVPAEAGRAEGDRVRFLWSNDRGLRVVKSLVFRRGDYLVDVEVEASQNGRRLPARITWGPGLEADDVKGAGQFHYSGQAVWNTGAQVVRRTRQKVDEETTPPLGGGLVWAGLEEQYFAAIVIPRQPAGASIVLRPMKIATADAPEKPQPQVIVAVSVPPEGAQLFVGPKKYHLLRSLGHDLQEAVWFSSYALVSWVAKLLFVTLIWIHDNLIANYGLAVILATLTLRLLLFPLNQYSMVSMKKMQKQMARIQPKINAVKARYKKKKDADSRSKMNQELMELYKREGVNPMGSMSGCLPMLAQFPILIAFYDVLIATVELRGAPFFGWIQDLTLKDPYYVTPLLMGATMFLQQKMTATKTADPQQAQQQRIMMMMPVVFTLMFLNLPAGLVLYWFVNNVLGIGQQWLVNRRIGRLDAAAQKA